MVPTTVIRVIRIIRRSSEIDPHKTWWHVECLTTYNAEITRIQLFDCFFIDDDLPSIALNCAIQAADEFSKKHKIEVLPVDWTEP